MQNVVNLHSPFIGLDGNPIVNGRVYFLKPDTSAQTFESLTSLDAGDYIVIKDRNGTALANPLPLDSYGNFQTQPFVDDNTDYKMIVCYPTGLPSELNDETPSWDIAYTVYSKTQHVDVHYDGMKTVGGLPELRTTDPALGTVLVMGYINANDFCPPRVFKWVNYTSTDNGGTKIRSSVTGHTNDGMWLLEPAEYVDVRWFGINPESGTDYTAQIQAVATAYTAKPLYFPAGSYYLSDHETVHGAILERLAIFAPVDGHTQDIKFEVSSHIENRGATFGKNEGDKVVYPKVKGTLYTSWLTSPIDSALTSTALANVDEIVFDATKTVSTSVTIAEKRVIVMKDVTVSSITFAPSCHVFYETDGKTCAGSLKLGNDWLIEPDDTQTVPEFKISKGVSLLAKLKASLVEFFVKVKMALGFLIDSDNAWEALDDSQSDWNNALVLKVQKVKAGAIRSESVLAQIGIIGACEIGVGTVDSSMKYVDAGLSLVGDGKLQFLDQYPFAYQSVTNGVVFLENVYTYYNQFGEGLPEGSTLHVIVDKAESFEFCFPNKDLKCNFILHFPLGVVTSVTFVECDDESTASNVIVLRLVKVLGIFAINTTTAFNRLLARRPTAEERTRYNIDNDVNWIFDPLAM